MNIQCKIGNQFSSECLTVKNLQSVDCLCLIVLFDDRVGAQSLSFKVSLISGYSKTSCFRGLRIQCGQIEARSLISLKKEDGRVLQLR